MLVGSFSSISYRGFLIRQSPVALLGLACVFVVWLVYRRQLPERRSATSRIGSVANLIVAEAARSACIEIGFLEYCRVDVPLTVVTLLIGWLVLVLVPV